MKRLIIVRGAGEMATGAALALHYSGFRVLILEQACPTSTRREVSFADAAYDGRKTVDRVTCYRVKEPKEAEKRLKDGEVIMMIDPEARLMEKFHPKVVVDAILAHENHGTFREMADHTIALGPGFCAGRDVDAVIETMRGHNLGRIIYEGFSSRSDAKPSQVDTDDTIEHILFAPAAGRLEALHRISDSVKKDDPLANIHCADGEIHTVRAHFSGVLRGIVRDGLIVADGQKVIDVNPRMTRSECFTVSDKARCVGGAVLQAVMRWESGKKKRLLF